MVIFRNYISVKMTKKPIQEKKGSELEFRGLKIGGEGGYPALSCKKRYVSLVHKKSL